jgi:Nuclease-related domain
MNHQILTALWTGFTRRAGPQGLIIIGYLLAYGFFAITAVELERKRRNSKKPFRDDDRLLRSPGEGVRKRWEDMTDKLLWRFLIGAALPLIVGYSVGFFVLLMAGLGLLSTRVVPYVGYIDLLGTLVVAYFSIRSLSRAVLSVGNCYLGYLGERYVADKLAPLTAKGCRIIHDLPSPMGNIDHVVVGTTGVYAIETKTKRKKGTMTGGQYVVTFDGHSLGWPWGIETGDLEQIEKNAVWLCKEIKRKLQKNTFVTPVLTIPGWWVEPKATQGQPRYARVWNPKWFEKQIRESPSVLASEDVNTIADELESRCKDVEF